MKPSLAIVLLSSLLIGDCRAHSDRTLAVDADESLLGLPSEYGPGKLRVVFHPTSGEMPIAEVQLQLGKNKMQLPSCLTSLVATRQLSDIRVVASWDHAEDILPYYIGVTFYDPGYNREAWANSGFSFLFNLRTARLIRVEVLIANGGSLQNLPLDLDAICPPEELKNVVQPIVA